MRIAILLLILPRLLAQTVPEYHIYAGNTHSHTSYTWSHGEQWTKSECAGILVYANNAWSDGYVKSKTGCFGIYVINGLQYPSPSMQLKPDYAKFQGKPAEHFAIARDNGYDFYATTDHSQEAGLLTQGADNPEWTDTKHAAAAATTPNFVALAGFEYSENDGPGGQGHINVFNTAGILNALAPGIDLPYFYHWLKTAAPNAPGPVVASFNHPSANQYNDWDYRDPAITDIITTLEVINSNNKIHYEGFLAALDKGWKVSPVCGNDNHGTGGITRQMSRTFVLAMAKDSASILDAMKHRRTYASLEKNLQCRYSVNGMIMGSTLNRPDSLRFHIAASDPDAKITKLDIVTNGGKVVETFTPPAPENTVEWNPVVADRKGTYFFVRVWEEQPIAWLAPVWTGR